MTVLKCGIDEEYSIVPEFDDTTQPPYGPNVSITKVTNVSTDVLEFNVLMGISSEGFYDPVKLNNIIPRA